MNRIRTLALVGAVGGAGTTRTAVNCGAALARGGRDVAVLDAAYATQGLSEFVPGRIDPDITALCLDPDRPLREGMYDLDVPTEGRLALVPAHAPFERLARAKAVAPAQAFEDRIEEAAANFDHVIVDAPPVASNQAVAAVHAVDRVALVAPTGDHGADGVNRQRDALSDIDVPDQEPLTVVVGGSPVDGEAGAAVDADADASLPAGPATFAAAPACLGDDDVAAAVVEATETLFGTDLGIEFEDASVVGRVRAGVERVRGGDD